jgi:alkanesulfonate monooxygenase SsuD/methylene tetrahydromethanopterin reductase-like flavin-dependent oxidoreductase (luciferase family)
LTVAQGSSRAKEGKRRPWDDLYEGLLQQIEAAERLGFDEVWLTEHHFTEDGYLPSLFPVAAAIASHTRSIRIGTNALLAVLHHLLWVAEDAAIIDILSRGRLDLGLTLGFRAVYPQAQRAAGLDTATIPAPVQSLAMFLYVAEDRETAWETTKPPVRYVVEQDRLWSGKAPQVTADALKRFGLVGPREDVADAIVQQVRESHPAQVCFFANPPGMDPELATASLRLFATRVRPAVEARLPEIASANPVR